MEIKFNSGDYLSLKKTLEFSRSVFHEGSKYYPQISLNEYL